MGGIEELLAGYSFAVTGFGIALLFGFAALSLRIRHQSAAVKRFLFGAIIVVTILPTLFLAGSTIYLNLISSSKGPVHWHADFEIWSCGREIELRDPTGLSNKIGTAILHEHNDKRIHLEGVVVEPRDASLGKFFRVIGGSLMNDQLTVPALDRTETLTSGLFCGDGLYQEVQVFVYKTSADGFYRQEKLTDPQNYIISPYANVPPGDCIIVELDVPKERTEKMCTSYRAAIQTGKLKGEKL